MILQSLQVRCLRGFVLSVLEYCSVMWCSAADTHLRLMDRVVSDACFLAGCARECYLSRRRSVAALFMQYKIRSTSMHSLCAALHPCLLC